MQLPLDNAHTRITPGQVFPKERTKGQPRMSLHDFKDATLWIPPPYTNSSLIGIRIGGTRIPIKDGIRGEHPQDAVVVECKSHVPSSVGIRAFGSNSLD